MKTKQPCLQEIRRKLGRLAAQQDAPRRSGAQDEQQLIGQIDPAEPAHLQQMRKELRLRHKALATERAYVGWVRRFMNYCGSQVLEPFGEPQIKSFLTHLAVEGNVSAGTHILCATVSRRIFWKTGLTSGQCKSSWVTKTWLPR